MKNYKIICFILAILLIVALFLLFFPSGKKSVSGKKVVIRFSVWGGAVEKNIWEKTIEAFEKKYPDIKIKLEILSSGYKDKLHTMLASETAPDVFYTDHSSMFYKFVSKNVLLNLDPYIESDKEINLDDFFPQALDMFRVQGHLYAFPKDLHTFVLYYNKDVFDRAGINYPDESWNWNKFLEISKKLTVDRDGDGVIDQHGFVWDPRYWIILVYQNGGSLFNKEKNRALMDDKKVIEAINFLNNTVQSKISINPGSVKYSELNQMFSIGKVAMFISGVWVGAEFRKSNFNWDVAPLPFGKLRATALVGSGPVIYSKTRHPKEAYEFAKFTVSVEAEKIYSELGVSIPTRKSVAYSDAFLNPKMPPKNAKVFLDEIKYSYTLEFDDFELGDEIYNNIVQPELDKIWFQNKNPESICPLIAKEVNKFLAEHR